MDKGHLEGTWGHWLGGVLGTLVRSLASPLNKSFNLLGFDLGTRDTRGDLGTLVREGVGDIG